MDKQLREINKIRDATRQDEILMAVHEVQALIDDTLSTTQEEIDVLLQDLNKKWPYRFNPMALTGKAIFFCDSNVYHTTGKFEPSDDEIIEHTFDDLLVTSHGFASVDRPEYVGGERIGTRHEIVHKVVLENEDYEWIEGYAGIDSAQLLPFELDEDVLIAEAQYFLPDEMTKIETAVLNAANETQAVKALRHVRFAPLVSQSLDGLTEDEYVSKLTAYVNRLITFDARVPYRITLEDDAVLSLHDVPRERRLGYPKYLTIEPLQDGSYGFYMTATILFNNHTENDVKFPLSSLRGFVSLREREMGQIANGAV